MKKFDKILKQLSDLYEFNQRIKGYELKKNEATDKWVDKDASARSLKIPASHTHPYPNNFNELISEHYSDNHFSLPENTDTGRTLQKKPNK